MGAIQNLGIVPEHRGRGLGSVLMMKALNGFRRVGPAAGLPRSDGPKRRRHQALSPARLRQGPHGLQGDRSFAVCPAIRHPALVVRNSMAEMWWRCGRRRPQSPSRRACEFLRTFVERCVGSVVCVISDAEGKERGMDQSQLFELPEEGPAGKPPRQEGGRPRLRMAQREQVVMRTLSLDQMLPCDDDARVAWDFVCQCDLSKLLSKIARWRETSAATPRIRVSC